MELKLYNENRDWHLDSLEIGTLYDYDQDVIKSYSSYIYHTPARKNTHTNSILSYRIPLS